MLDIELNFHRITGIKITKPRKIGECSYSSEMIITTNSQGKDIANKIDLFSGSGEALSDIKIEKGEGK